MRKIKWFFSVLMLIIIFTVVEQQFNPMTTYAYDPHDVPSHIKNNWWQNYGNNQMSDDSGKRLHYDVYEGKGSSNKNGYKVQNYNLGNGSQPYLVFDGWAVIMRHRNHNENNQSTYIVAENRRTGEEKVYNTMQLNRTATRDLQFNVGVGSYPWCGDTVRNRSVTASNGCNMTYENVGFRAYLPLNELFPDAHVDAEWDLYIVKQLGLGSDRNVVYSELIVPFEFSDTSFKTGKLDLSSGVDIKSKFRIGSSNVYKRNQPRGTNTDYGYFNKSSTYTYRAHDETQTAIWYGVQTNGTTLYASSVYWTLEGSQASLKYTFVDNRPPDHVSHGIENHRYKNGNDYWVQPNDLVQIRLRGIDRESLLKHTYLQLNGNGVNARAEHDYSKGITNVNFYNTSAHVDILSARRTLESATKFTREATFNARPKTHGHNYNVLTFHRDNAELTTGWIDTMMNLRVDGVPPNNSREIVQGARHSEGGINWIRPNDPVSVQVRGHDADSGLSNTLLSLGGGSERIVVSHDWNGTATNRTVTTDTFDGFDFTSLQRNHNGTTSKEVEFFLRGRTHGSMGQVRHRYVDNAENVSLGDNHGWSSSTQYIAVDGLAPQNVAETIRNPKYRDENNISWFQPNDLIEISLRGEDVDSGLRRSLLSIGLADDRLVILHDWNESLSTNYEITANTKTNFVFDHLRRNSQNGNEKELSFFIRGNEHGSVEIIRNRYVDNVENVSIGDAHGWSDSFQSVGIDGEAPEVEFSPNESDWRNDQLQVNVTVQDDDSGLNRFRWRVINNNESLAWSNWILDNSMPVTIDQKGENIIEVEAIDNVGNRSLSQSGVYLINTPPEIDRSHSPVELYEGDNAEIILIPNDHDNHKMNVKLELKLDNGEWEELYTWEDIINGDTLNYTLENVKVADYTLQATVVDEYDAQSIREYQFYVKPLSISGSVDHTNEWKQTHTELNTMSGQFFSGERFLTNAVVTDHPIEKVTVQFVGEQITGESLTLDNLMTPVVHPIYETMVFHEDMATPDRKLKDGVVYFIFEATWQNGTVKQDIVSVDIIDDVYGVFDLYRSN